jgi:hypothetical protein
MPKANSRVAQRSSYRKNVEKLQRAGLIGKVDFRKHATPEILRRIDKYRDVTTGKAAAVIVPDLKTARNLRKTLGLKGSGNTVVIPREKHERYKFKKSTGEIVSERKGYVQGEKIKKTLTKGFPAKPAPGSDKRLYYTIPERTRGAGKLKRRTFGTFDEMLYYLSKYDVDFEDIEDRIEVEEITRGGRADKKRQTKIHEDREAGAAKLKRKRKREANAAKKKSAPAKKRSR